MIKSNNSPKGFQNLNFMSLFQFKHQNFMNTVIFLEKKNKRSYIKTNRKGDS